MTKPQDPDFKALRTCVHALLTSSSVAMLAANMRYLHDRFVLNPRVKDIERVRQNSAGEKEGE
jgi:hypothetical protein